MISLCGLIFELCWYRYVQPKHRTNEVGAVRSVIDNGTVLDRSERNHAFWRTRSSTVVSARLADGALSPGYTCGMAAQRFGAAASRCIYGVVLRKVRWRNPTGGDKMSFRSVDFCSTHQLFASLIHDLNPSDSGPHIPSFGVHNSDKRLPCKGTAQRSDLHHLTGSLVRHHLARNGDIRHNTM